MTVAAPIESVWRVVADVTRTGEWSHECHHVVWLGGAAAATPGVLFRGHNRSGWLRWSRTCEVLTVDAPRQIAWRTIPTRLFVDSTDWRITLEPVGTGTRIVQSFRVTRCPDCWEWVVARVNTPHIDRSAALTMDLHRIGEVAAADAGAAGAYTIKALGADTWDDFEALAGRHNGVWGGCWCMWFHPENAAKGSGAEGNRVLKKQLVEAGRAHAALVFDGAEAVAWCEYGPPAELSNIYHRKAYEAGLDRLPDYRLTCFFVDRRYRRKGVAAAALRGALELIARAGGGVVEAYPRDTAGKKISASFLYNGTRSMFEDAGFRYDRPKGRFNCVMITTVPPAQSIGAAGDTDADTKPAPRTSHYQRQATEVT